MAWNRDRTRCIDSRQAAVENTNCSRWPGSVPMWNKKANRAECFCPQGMAWNRDRTRCIDARQAAVENTNCSRWPGSVPMWNKKANRAECFCPRGMVWNSDRTRCIDERQAQADRTPPRPPGPVEKAVFGTSAYLPNSFKGDIYYLPAKTTSLPNFAALKPVGSIYTKALDVPERKFEQGFPGVSNRIEWFAIRYTGRFYVSKPGTYGFRLHSDDGSRLYIDRRLTINNDGLHPPRSASGNILLNQGWHDIMVNYFQGPRFHVALQLFVKPPGGAEAIFRMP
jgi:hypothetical protein